MTLLDLLSGGDSRLLIKDKGKALQDRALPAMDAALHLRRRLPRSERVFNRSLHGHRRITPKTPLHQAKVRIAKVCQKLVRPGKRQDVVPHIARIPVPLNEEPFFAGGRVTGQGSVREAEFSWLVHSVNNPAGIEPPETHQPGYNRDVLAYLDWRFDRPRLQPATAAARLLRRSRTKRKLVIRGQCLRM
jgi:hypothetical protein